MGKEEYKAGKVGNKVGRVEGERVKASMHCGQHQTHEMIGIRRLSPAAILGMWMPMLKRTKVMMM